MSDEPNIEDITDDPGCPLDGGTEYFEAYGICYERRPHRHSPQPQMQWFQNIGPGTEILFSFATLSSDPDQVLEIGHESNEG